MSMNLSIHDIRRITLEPLHGASGGGSTSTLIIVDKRGEELAIDLFGVDEAALRIRLLDEDGTEVGADMLTCPYCQRNKPRSEFLRTRDGKLYCSGPNGCYGTFMPDGTIPESKPLDINPYSGQDKWIRRNWTGD